MQVTLRSQSNNFYESALQRSRVVHLIQCQLQMLHCIKQVETIGGDNEFSDAFNAAYQLRDEHPDYYRLLTQRDINHWDLGIDNYKFFKMTKQPCIQ